MRKKYSNLQSIKSSQIKQLQRLDEPNQPGYKFISPKFAQPLAAINKEIVFDQDSVLLVGVQTEDVSVHLFGYAVSREG
ncbi:hypothetical protein [Nostoc sp. CHAB 5715]|uniref:hypothetical protein n=1 Tax=Nostoc sp. CHAB 5715 TaxID=2780400 RepID=UPI001E5AF9E6|nr:hypothetical protein [Nostoc sp. CHAB 5715]MCC5625506.1 hypothetical protein [Nostoc sp. CHAB 5715]